MIPLAQYLSDHHSGDFTPLRPVGERRALQPLAREPLVREPMRPALNEDDEAPRPARAAPVRSFAPPAASLQPIVESRAPRIDIEAERAAWTQERDALEEKLERLVEEAREAGRKAALAETDADVEARLVERTAAAEAAVEARAADALAAERSRWVEEESDRLADLMILQMAVFEDAMKLTVKNVLRPLAIDARQRQALDELAEAVKLLIASEKGVEVTASGPSDLLGKLQERLGDQFRRLSIAPDDGRIDLRVEANGTAIETRLSSWAKALDEALA